MRTVMLCLALGALALASCNAGVDPSAAPAGPLIEGEVLELTIYARPISPDHGGIGDNWSYDRDSGARVEVYADFIVVSDKHGMIRVALHGWYDRLLLK